ncbi:MAG TPA: 4-hydroxy-tetrahydrodipicolinate synthase, partial [Acidimicrobiales bacterium]|nr:4-hydroxy-tetrahydrodipicolinate synthase [Acidimicrobiales bacterium]
SDGLVLAGSTGEGTLLTDSEKRDLWQAVASAISIPVLAATGSADTRHSVQLTEAASQSGVDGILLVTPYYVRPSQEGLANHFSQVAASTTLPILLYDIPARTGRRIEISTTLHLARECSNIVGIKDASGDMPSTAKLAAQAPDGFQIYCGEDSLTLAMAALGAVGIISVASHWAGREMGEMLDCLSKGDTASAAEINSRLTESWAFESSEEAPNPIPTKAVLRMLGLPSGQCRLPLGLAPGGTEAGARSVIHNLNQFFPGRLRDPS